MKPGLDKHVVLGQVIYAFLLAVKQKLQSVCLKKKEM